MSDITNITLNSLADNSLKRIMPEPTSSYTFKNVVSAIKSVISDTSTPLLGINSEYAELINKQMEMQEQMLLVSMVSNIEKTTHETKMAAVRNIRVS